jgi:hypothetical protein
MFSNAIFLSQLLHLSIFGVLLKIKKVMAPNFIDKPLECIKQQRPKYQNLTASWSSIEQLHLIGWSYPVRESNQIIISGETMQLRQQV